MNPAIVIELIVGKPEIHGGANGAIISIQSCGPSGEWQFAAVTESESLVNQIQKMSLWTDLANSSLGISSEDRELANFVLLEGGCELALLSTPQGFAVEARQDDRRLDLRKHTRVWVKPEKIVEFVNRLRACVSGESLGVTIGEVDYSLWSTPTSVPMIELSGEGLADLRNQPATNVSVDVSSDDLKFVRDTLKELTETLTIADKWSEPSTETYWCPTGSVRLDATIVTDPESLVRHLELTIGSPAYGSLWTVPMGRPEVEQSVSRFEKDSQSIVLYGRLLPALPM